VHGLHEGMKVDARLAGDVRRQRVVEEVHHHGLSGADVAEHVDAFGEGVGYGRASRGGGARGEEGEEALLRRLERFDGGRLDSGLRVVLEHVVQVLEILDDT